MPFVSLLQMQRNWKNWHSGCVHLLHARSTGLYICVCVGRCPWSLYPREGHGMGLICLPPLQDDISSLVPC